MSFFKPLSEHYKLYFLNDFKHLLKDLNTNYYGMLEQLITSRGETFLGTYFSTFTGYIHRMRGYHSHKDKLPGYKEGKLHSYFFSPKSRVRENELYRAVQNPFWAREFPISWRDIDKGIGQIRR
mmetsp:Transcript_22535/g.34743  ORF Transcript_22535/g.34743 Transcript_22535/m.34743 type:complete len:124 (-) Transcript_22535:333-704(-)